MKNRTETISPASDAKEPSLFERNKLRISAGFNLLGDVGLFVDGYNKGKAFRMVAGGFYTFGAGIAALFGSTNKKQQFKDLKLRTAEFLHGLNESKNTQIQSAKIIQKFEKADLLTKASTFLRRYAGQVMLGFYTLGAAVLFAGGVKDYHTEKGEDKPKIGDIGAGGSSLIVKITSLLLPEKRVKKGESENKKEQSTVDWLKEKPMRLFGYGSLLTEGFWAYRTYEDARDGEDWKWSATTTASYALSDIVIATANKDAANAAGQLNGTQREQLEEMIAETIAHQNADRRVDMTSQAVEFLEGEVGVEAETTVIRQSLEQRIAKHTPPKTNWKSYVEVDVNPLAAAGR